RRPLDRYANRAPSATLIGVGAADSITSKESTMSRSARAAAPSAVSSLVQAFGPEAEQIPPALAERIAEVVELSQAEPANNPEPAFFAALARRREPGSSMGGSWRAAELRSGAQYTLSNVDAALSGLSGLAQVLAAAEWARTE